MSTVRILHFPERGVAAILEEPMPDCGPRQIRIRTEYSGVSNGTERSFLMGGPYGSSTWPCRCGYQAVGVVERVGDQVSGYAAGDRVFCGVFRHHASHLVIDVADRHAPGNITAVLPAGIDPTHAALFGVGGVAMHDTRKVRTGIGDRALVVGAGVIGQFAAQAAQAAGAETVIANRGRDRLDVATRCGVRQTIQITGEETWRQLKEPGFDVVIETSGGDVLDAIIGTGFAQLGVLRPEGRLFLCAGRFDVAYKCGPAQARRIEIHHTTHFRRDDLLELIRLTEAGVIRVGPMIRDVVPVDQAPAIYRKMRDEPHALLGTVFRWS